MDRQLIEAPLSKLTAVELPMAILLRRRNGNLNEAEATHTAIMSLADCVIAALESGSCYELVMFINAMAETIAPERRIQQPAVEVGTVRDADDPGNRLVVVMGEGGSPVADGEGKLAIFSLKELRRVIALAGATAGAIAH
jgi:hypothetical protein